MTRTVDPDLPHVRLSKDGKWAVCASVQCGERFAARIERGALGGAALDFLPGWYWLSGEWQMSKRARRRLSAGRSPALRRVPFRQMHQEAREDGWSRDRSDRPSFTQNALKFPVTVICPACGLPQNADADALRLK